MKKTATLIEQVRAEYKRARCECVSVRFTDNDIARLDRLAEQFGSRSNVLRAGLKILEAVDD